MGQETKLFTELNCRLNRGGGGGDVSESVERYFEQHATAWKVTMSEGIRVSVAENLRNR